jgi:hypothetical protein
LKFGNEQVLSVRGTPGARVVSLDALGNERKALLKDTSAGFYDTAPMGHQYLVLPQSVADSWGTRFVCDLTAEVNALYPQEIDYNPQIVTYDDHGSRTYGRQARALQTAFEAQRWQRGCAVVMVHPASDKARRKEDELEACAVRELDALGLTAAVMHTQMGRASYVEAYDNAGNSTYAPHPQARGKLSGYLSNVALNKSSGRWAAPPAAFTASTFTTIVTTPGQIRRPTRSNWPWRPTLCPRPRTHLRMHLLMPKAVPTVPTWQGKPIRAPSSFPALRLTGAHGSW